MMAFRLLVFRVGAFRFGASGFGLLLLAVAALAGGAFAPGAAQQPQSLPTQRIEILSGAQRHAFTVERAETEAQRAQGLMFRRHLAADAGMLFVYPSPRPVSMWMKNTLIPLDMLFVDGEGRIVFIHARAVPGSLKAIGAPVRVRAVVELAGGTADRLGIAVGDRVAGARLGPGG